MSQAPAIVLQWSAAFLDLLHQRDAGPDEREDRLVQILDMLAVLRHQAYAAEDHSPRAEKKPPEWPYRERRILAADCYPRLGLYHVVAPDIPDQGPPEILTGDAVDDVADIAGDLHEVRWRWAHTSPEDALWHFRHSFDHHWGEHLRLLRWYLHHARRNAERSPP